MAAGIPLQQQMENVINIYPFNASNDTTVHAIEKEVPVGTEHALLLHNELEWIIDWRELPEEPAFFGCGAQMYETGKLGYTMRLYADNSFSKLGHFWTVKFFISALQFFSR